VLVDSSVDHSFAVVGWTSRLVTLCGGRLLLADGVHSTNTAEPRELRSIRDAIMRRAYEAGLGSGLSSRALAAVQGNELLGLAEHGAEDSHPDRGPHLPHRTDQPRS
jgi:hypothetical protein